MKKIYLYFTAGVLIMLMQACTPAGSESNRQGLEAYNKGEYKSALDLFSQAVTQNESENDYYVNQGQAYYKLGEYTDALNSFTKALEIDNDSFNALRGAGLCHKAMDNNAQAEEYLTKALNTSKGKNKENMLDIRGYLAEIFLKDGRFQEAIDQYNVLIGEKYHIRDIYQMIGNAYAEVKDESNALIYYQKCLDIDNRDYNSYISMAEKLSEEGCTEASDTVLNAALEVIPYEPQDWCFRGRIYYMLGDTDKAFSSFEESFNKGYEEAGYYLGYCYEINGNYAEAELIYQRQLESGSDASLLYNQMALCDIRQGKYSEALVMLEKGKSDAGEDIRKLLLWNECMCYEKAGMYDKTVEALAEYCKTYADDNAAEKEMQFIYSR